MIKKILSFVAGIILSAGMVFVSGIVLHGLWKLFNYGWNLLP